MSAAEVGGGGQPAETDATAATWGRDLGEPSRGRKASTPEPVSLPSCPGFGDSCPTSCYCTNAAVPYCPCGLAVGTRAPEDCDRGNCPTRVWVGPRPPCGCDRPDMRADHPRMAGCALYLPRGAS